ncbi:class I SAM-dependent methyltransferase [Kaustia mangrovi]|nr:methyltransferase domain-containing protein [Kaustia mangrovi]
MSKLTEMKEEAVRRAYARWAPVYDMTFGLVAEFGRSRTVDFINRRRGRVLEVGVGTGMSLPRYRPEIEVTGIDLSPEMLAKARARVARRGLDNVAAIEEMDASDMAFEDNSFDVVVAMYVMTVVPDPERVMRELARVCRPGGEVLVVNHFSQDHGIRGAVEKGMARFAEALGWRPEFPLDTVLVCEDLELKEEQPLKPFGLFTMLRFVKTEPGAARPLAPKSGTSTVGQPGGVRVGDVPA